MKQMVKLLALVLANLSPVSPTNFVNNININTKQNRYKICITVKM